MPLFRVPSSSVNIQRFKDGKVELKTFIFSAKHNLKKIKKQKLGKMLRNSQPNF